MKYRVENSSKRRHLPISKLRQMRIDDFTSGSNAPIKMHYKARAFLRCIEKVFCIRNFGVSMQLEEMITRIGQYLLLISIYIPCPSCRQSCSWRNCF